MLEHIAGLRQINAIRYASLKCSTDTREKISFINDDTQRKQSGPSNRFHTQGRQTAADVQPGSQSCGAGVRLGRGTDRSCDGRVAVLGLMHIIGPNVHQASACEAVLRTLPKWFGIEPALLMYARDSATMPTFALVKEDAVVGFITLQEHFANAWEVHCLAITADARGQGHGSRLLAHAESWLGAKGVRFLQVKTVAATSPSVAYAQTREFYSRRGFVPVEIFPTLWDAHNPALQCIKALHAV